ncbi:hypothetical protein COV19_06890 [Candidatus Woesearchaeota archaeon CG10_big_fil_rev_8_21_14_0_10_44_13]|nr:MAG: hypothetical protein COV19_06890 [Candidatus Woesearchaeota archaeon CG10_big_fil_rev_8_21_14_0_10_44_13]
MGKVIFKCFEKIIEMGFNGHMDWMVWVIYKINNHICGETKVSSPKWLRAFDTQQQGPHPHFVRSGPNNSFSSDH